MSHPGMAPVLRTRAERGPGVYDRRSRSRCPATGCCSSPSRCPTDAASSVASTSRTSGRPDDTAAPDVRLALRFPPGAHRPAPLADRRPRAALAPPPHGRADRPAARRRRRRRARAARPATRADEPGDGADVDSLSRPADRRAAGGRQPVLRRLSDDPRARSRRAGCIAPTRRWPRWLRRQVGRRSRCSSRCSSPTSCSICGRCPAATAWLVIGYFGAALLVDLDVHRRGLLQARLPGRPVQLRRLDAVAAGSRASASRRVCRTCTHRRLHQGTRAEPAAPATVAAARLRAGALPADRRSATSIAPSASTACRPARTTTSRSASACRATSWPTIAAARRSAACRGVADLAALALVFTFGALLNAFAMTAPVYAVEAMAGAARRARRREAPVLGLVFVIALGARSRWRSARGAASLTRPSRAHRRLRVRDIAVRYAYALVPFGVGVWLAHYGFHFLTGARHDRAGHAERASIDAAGAALLGEPDWRWLGLRAGAVFPLQIGVVLLGAIGSIALVASHLRARSSAAAPARAAAPWVARDRLAHRAGAVDPRAADGDARHGARRMSRRAHAAALVASPHCCGAWPP